MSEMLSPEQKTQLQLQENRQKRPFEKQEPFHFADRLTSEMKKKKSVVCVGLDPRLEQIPNFLKEKAQKSFAQPLVAAAEAMLEFNKGIIDAVADLVPVIKPQSAFFEQYGHEGMRAFEETVHYARSKGLLTIADIKRGDIGSTAAAYAQAFLGKVDLFGKQVFSFDVDAVTVNPYLGIDGIKPFVDEARTYGKGVFVLVKTSNASSCDLQDLPMKDGNTIYEIMAQYMDSWGADDVGESGYSFLGAVVGATFPKQAKKLRELMPQTIFLVPGYGAQGGTAEDVQVCFDEHGLGALVNSSRAINYAWENSEYTEKDYAVAAREVVLKMNKDLDFIR